MNYQVEIIEEPFLSVSGTASSKTVIVSLCDEKGILQKTMRYGLLVMYELMDRKGSCSLDGFYVKDFDINLYHNLFEWENGQILKKFMVKNCFFDGFVNFQGTRFGKEGFNVEHSYFGNGNVDFSNTQFDCEVLNLSGIIFGDGDISFRSSDFYCKSIDFYGTNFGSGKVDFSVTNFYEGKVNFSGASFGDGDIDFSYSNFALEGLDFSGVNFGKGNVSFKSSNFNHGTANFFYASFQDGVVTFDDLICGNGDTDFSFSVFDKIQVSFKYTKFGLGRMRFGDLKLTNGSMNFTNVNFSGEHMTFHESIIDKLSIKNSIFHDHVDFKLKECNELLIENCIIEKTFDLMAASNDSMKIKTLSIHNTKNLGMIYIDWDKNDIKNMIYSQGKKTSNMEKAEQFRLLKENFRNIGHYNNEDLAYLEFKRCESMSKLKGENLMGKPYRKIKILGNLIVFPFRWFVLDYIGRYATSPIRILYTMIATLFGFALIYSLPFITLSGNKVFLDRITNPMLSRFLTSLYHSITTLFTIGYGDINPGNIPAMLLSGVEGFVGLFLMSYFTVAFVRKILR